MKVNQQTVRNWIGRRELPAVRVGACRVRIRQSDLDAFLESGAGARKNTSRSWYMHGRRTGSNRSAASGRSRRRQAAQRWCEAEGLDETTGVIMRSDRP